MTFEPLTKSRMEIHLLSEQSPVEGELIRLPHLDPLEVSVMGIDEHVEVSLRDDGGNDKQAKPVFGHESVSDALGR